MIGLKQVQLIQDIINEQLSKQFKGLKLQMQVQRINVSVVSGSEVLDRIDLKQSLDEVEGTQPSDSLMPETQELKEIKQELC